MIKVNQIIKMKMLKGSKEENKPNIDKDDTEAEKEETSEKQETPEKEKPDTKKDDSEKEAERNKINKKHSKMIMQENDNTNTLVTKPDNKKKKNQVLLNL